MPWKENARIDLYPHQDAIVTLRRRGYSFGEIAEWFAKELNAPVKRGQVYYIYQQHQLESKESFERAYTRGETKFVPTPKLTDAEAESAAAKADAKKP